MNSLSHWWGNAGLQRKLQILIQGFLIVILIAAQLWITAKVEERSMRAAEDRTAIVADGVINSLNTLMSTQVEGHDVISDEKARALFISKMGVSDGLKELRVIRGKGNDEFGPGLAMERPVDALDQEVLANGKTIYRALRDDKGGASLRAVIPYIAYKEFRTSRCLDCHAVAEGNVLGAVSVTTDISADIDSIRRINLLIWAGQGGLQVVLFFVIQAIVRRQLRQL
ncbi:MAG: hypothetical protein ACR2I0_03230, partial [Rhodoferax sp.]